MKCDALAREEEVRRLPFRYIESVKYPDVRMLSSNHEMRDAFRVHFRDRFARYPDLPVQEIRNYLADFPRFREAEAASCEGLVTVREVCDALKQFGFNKSPGLNGYPPAHLCAYSDGCVQPLFRPGSHPWLRYQGRDWEELDVYRPITLLNTELKILARVLANHLHLVINDLSRTTL